MFLVGVGLCNVVGLDGTSHADGSTLLGSKVECIGGALETSLACLFWLLSCETLSPPMDDAVFGAKSGMGNPCQVMFCARRCSMISYLTPNLSTKMA